MATGIRVRQGKNGTTYEAWIYSKRDKKKIRRSFPTLAAAKGWRTDAAKAVKDKKLRAPSSKTLRQEVDEWLAGARDGRILNRRKQRYKPAVIRIYEIALKLRVLPELGDRRLTDIDHADLLELKEQLLGEGCSASTIRNTFTPLQAVYRRACRNGTVPMNPTLDLELPAAGSRDRAATPAQAAQLIDALGDVRALWATAFYAGLRRGELQAVRVRNVNLDAGTISVEHGWDAVEGEILPKSEAGVRRVFILDALRPLLSALVDGRAEAAFVFGSDTAPFDTRSTERKARRRAPEVEWFGLHEARHSFSTFMDHAGISETRADRYMGHARKEVAGRYRHLLPGQLAEDARRVDEYLAGAVAGKVVQLPRAESVAWANRISRPPRAGGAAPGPKRSDHPDDFRLLDPDDPRPLPLPRQLPDLHGPADADGHLADPRLRG
jgi:integrase